MTTYPTHPEKWLASTMSTLLRRVTMLEQRTRNIDSGTLLQTITGVIDPAYVSGQPMVTITGAAALTGPYQRLVSYTPVASDLVLLIPSGSTYVVAGKLV